MWPSAFQPQTSNIAGAIEYVAPVTIAATTTASAVTQLPAGDPSSQPNIRVENQSTSWVICNFGDGAQGSATLTNGIGIPPNTARTVTLAPSSNSVSVILVTAAATGPVRFLRGIGIAD